jgi:Flp pilus assembly protein TadD
MSLPDATAESDRLCDEGYALLEAGRFDEAHALLARARALAPSNPLIHYRMGLLFNDTGRPAEALESLDTSLSPQPDNARAHNNRGSVLQLLGRASEAEKAFQRALDLSPDLELPYINLGHLMEQQGKVREATDLYDRAIARGLDPTVFSHYLATARTFSFSGDRPPKRWLPSTRTPAHAGPRFVQIATAQSPAPGRALCR